ncbi:hypothetical protein ANANG_G00177510 [Anguilla anguilla]|uniref:Uncharacterized protein n=1 Tax=Anguilla anguilla TaxID=7936 RepID=A0A9D3M619_ANGAN|nr:hypothetical protein ANANG_G00177510 [Anguilla anguilla]
MYIRSELLANDGNYSCVENTSLTKKKKRTKNLDLLFGIKRMRCILWRGVPNVLSDLRGNYFACVSGLILHSEARNGAVPVLLTARRSLLPAGAR